MERPSIRRRERGRRFSAPPFFGRTPSGRRWPGVLWPRLVLGLMAPLLPAQCLQQGSEMVGAQIESGPLLGCSAAPSWPYWHLVTPPHRAVVPKSGFTQGTARMLPRLFVHWRCTGFLLLPVLPDRIRTMGYVFDVEEVPCPPQAR